MGTSLGPCYPAGLETYGWAAHDGESFGRQELTDGGVRLTTSLAKRFCTGCAGGDWALRLAARAASPKPKGGKHGGEGEEEVPRTQRRVSFILYIANEDVRPCWFNAHRDAGCFRV